MWLTSAQRSKTRGAKFAVSRRVSSPLFSFRVRKLIGPCHRCASRESHSRHIRHYSASPPVCVCTSRLASHRTAYVCPPLSSLRFTSLHFLRAANSDWIERIAFHFAGVSFDSVPIHVHFASHRFASHHNEQQRTVRYCFHRAQHSTVHPVECMQYVHPTH